MRSKIFILFLGVIFASVAQRRVTPVDPTAKREIVPVQTDSVVAEPEEPEKEEDGMEEDESQEDDGQMKLF